MAISIPAEKGQLDAVFQGDVREVLGSIRRLQFEAVWSIGQLLFPECQ